MFLLSYAFSTLISGSALASTGHLETSYYRICKQVEAGKGTPAQAHGVKQIQFIVKNNECEESAKRLWALDTLDLTRTDLETTELFDGLDKLKFLFVEKNPIQQLEIKNLRSLQGFFASATPATHLKLVNLPALREVRAGLSKISTIELSKLPSLEIFDASYNQLENLDFTVNIPSTQKLFVSGNKLTKFDAPALVQLNMIEAHENQISSLEGIERHGALETIHFDHNLIEDLTPLKTLRYLYKIDLSYNKIRDVSPLVGLKLDYMTSLRLNGNPIGKSEKECPIKHNFLELRMFCAAWRQH